MDSRLREQLGKKLDEYLRCQASKGKLLTGNETIIQVPYGTAGFRGKASQIEPIFFNVGLIAALRCLQSQAKIGIMITASHNPVQDNGVKLIDGNGEMLSPEWESIVEEFCNTFDKEATLDQLDKLIRSYNLETTINELRGQVLLGMDARPSSEALAALVKQGLEAWSPNIKYIDYGHVTTPALHYLVAESNKKRESNLQSYYKFLSTGLVDMFSEVVSCKKYSPDQLVIDCANGVGFETMRMLCGEEKFNKSLAIKLINTGDGILNELCGADYVKTKQLAPVGADDPTKRYAALDGDADRVVYFYLLEEGSKLSLKLLDGDKIMALYALYLKDLLEEYNLGQALSLGIVQTAYANGASTNYMTKALGLKVDCVDTGVKNLHKQALKYDLGVYFEANGHGTICISSKASAIVQEGNYPRLKRLFAIVNNYTGDAISDILAVESILRYYDWSVQQWYELYCDRPSSLVKVEIPNRNLIKTTNAARTCVEPPELQSAIETKVAKFGPGARSFVRASGTENVVRVYAEADELISAEKLASEVCDEVKRLCIISS